MKRKVRGRITLIGITVILSVLFFLPSTPFYAHLPAWWGKYLPSRGVTLGLDLQGGMHLVMEVEGAKTVEGGLAQSMGTLQRSMEEKKIVLTAIVRESQQLRVTFPEVHKQAMKELLADAYPFFTVTETKSVAGLSSPEKPVTTFLVSYKAGEVERLLDSATAQALETIRNRVDQFGVAEPLIQRQADNQILVQLPGVKDPKRAMELIGRTALLEFKLLDESHPVAHELPDRIGVGKEAEILATYQSKIPPDDEILFERISDQAGNVGGKQPYLVKKEAVLTGAMLSDARVSIGDFNTPYVSIEFDAAGAKAFEKITETHVQKRLAIVLDHTVYSAPVIQEKIAGGRAQISGTYTMDEANDLAIVLRAGALPAPVEIIQNVTVGPSLGQDSIDKGMTAGIVGILLIVAFMLIYYRLSGLLADLAMGLNIILLIGALAALNATLTLPGIAGIILTIGMAVDSNVLIFERIRDELRLGKPVRLAVDAGYDKAFSSILDSHVTTLITAFVLFLFGTGPIKGFAISLSLGVTINLFTSLVGTRVIFDGLLERKRLTRLSI